MSICHTDACYAPHSGGIKQWWRLSVTYIRHKSRTERPRKTKIGSEVAHVTRGSDTTLKVKRSKSTCRGVGYCGGLPHSLFSFADHLHLLNMSNWRYDRTLQNGPACYHKRTMQLLVGTQFLENQVRFLTAIFLIFVHSHCCNSHFRNITQLNFRFHFCYENRSAKKYIVLNYKLRSWYSIYRLNSLLS